MDAGRPFAIIAVAAIVGALAAGFWASEQSDQYRATSVVAVGPAASLVEDSERISVIGSIDRSGMPATIAGLATSRSVRDRTAESLGLAPSALSDYEIDSTPVLSANLVDITVTGPDATLAADTANTIANDVSAQFTQLYRVYDVTVITEASQPDNSTRPSIVTVAVAGAAAGAAAAAVCVVAFSARTRRRWFGVPPS